MSETKQCSRCKRIFPKSADYFSRDTRPSRDGYYSWCKECESSKAKPDTAKRRFLDGTGERFTGDGRIRCHAVSMYKLRQKAGPENRRLTDEEIWPDCQCRLAATPGVYVCRFHGGHHKHRKQDDMNSYVKTNLADRVLLALQDPEILDQRKNIALLEARNSQLLEQLESGGLTQYDSLQALRRGVNKIKAGDVADGVSSITATLDALADTKASWDELRTNMRTIQGLQQAEVKRQKEMRLTLTAEQVMAKFEQLVQGVLAAVEKNVSDPKIIEGVWQDVTTQYRKSIGTPGLGLLANPHAEDGEN